jgi:metal-dependent hydrolase (beta-lactamase superfamily II)
MNNRFLVAILPNNCGFEPNFLAEHGLAVLLESAADGSCSMPGRTLSFDTTRNDLVVRRSISTPLC